MKIQFKIISLQKLILCVFVLITYSSCLEEGLFSDDVFAGPSEYTITFQSGSFIGKTYTLVSQSTTNDHEFLISKQIQKILSKPIQEKLSTNLKSASFINWAWTADTITGIFPAIFANDPNVSKSGDMQLLFTNGDELISSIPKGTSIDVTTFGGPQGGIRGSFSFTSALDFRLNNQNKRETASIFIEFHIKRGPNR